MLSNGSGAGANPNIQRRRVRLTSNKKCWRSGRRQKLAKSQRGRKPTYNRDDLAFQPERLQCLTATLLLSLLSR
jgi:hypothetical protein